MVISTVERVSVMCDYMGHEFGAPYPDSVCIEGYLWDADSCEVPGGPLYHGGEIPCPQCNHKDWLEYHRESVEEKGFTAHEGGVPRDRCPYPEKARYPEDGETLRAWWMKGWDEAAAECATTKI